MIGRALGHDLKRAGGPVRVVIGQDTRQSSAWIADRVTHGLMASGVEVHSAGVITTPGVAYLARSRKYHAGVVISASHNPWTDNGIKVFSGDGYKLPDAHEIAIEQEIFALLQNPEAHVDSSFQLSPSLPGQSELRQAYIAWLAKNVGADLSRLRVLVDCANGAAAVEAPELFRLCRIPATFLSASPDGQNINDNCGALHPETVGRAVAEKPGQFDLGVTFDGDADRALFCDANGRVVNGDAVLLLTARYMKSQGALPGETVVATTMSNMGLEIALRNSGIRLLRANVGDKYVLEEMQKSGAVLGGEQSGHIILAREHTTGDGLLTALHVVEIVARSGRPLAELVAGMKVFPQTIKNVRVREKKPLEQVPEAMAAITAAEKELKGNGRVNVRYSGTESLARVMVEAAEEKTVNRLADTIASALERALGVGGATY
jgi:phosphoglucosamine mutase